MFALVLLVGGLGLVALYEFAKVGFGSGRGSGATGLPAACCAPECCAGNAPVCDGTGSGAAYVETCCALACCACGYGVTVNCCQITYDTSSWPTGDRVWDVCRAIAIAEGANNPGSAPDRYNNPGDLSRGDEHGQQINGYVTLTDGEEEIVFATKRAGWNALYAKVSRAASGKSTVYSRAMTWLQFGQKYAGDSTDWVNNVTAALGVSPGDTFGSYFG